MNKRRRESEDDERPEMTTNDLITTAILASLASLVGIIVSNLRIKALVGLGNHELMVHKERNRMPRYGYRKIHPVIEADL